MSAYVKHFAFIFLLLTGLSGMWLRLYSLFSDVHLLPYDHILHAHSHIAVLGWCFLAAFIIYCHMIWDEIQAKKEAVLIAITTFIVSILMFIAFLYQGYALYSIILSSIHILVEYWAIIFIIKTSKKLHDIPRIVKMFLYGSLISLFISSIGPWSLGVIGAKGLKDSPLFDMAIYFYLHFQYNGWLFFMIIGLFLLFLHHKKLLQKENMFTVGFFITFIALFPAFLLSILWYDVGSIGITFAWVGAIGQLIGTLIIAVELFRQLMQVTERKKRSLQLLLFTVFSLLIIKSVLELGLLHVPFAQMIYETRSVVIGYLHLTFLGFITLALFTLFVFTNMLPERKLVFCGFYLFLTGFIVNESTLFLDGLFSWLPTYSLSGQNELLLLASLLLTVSVLIVWYSLFSKDSLSQHKYVYKRSEIN